MLPEITWAIGECRGKMGWKGALGLAARLKLVDGLGLRSLSLSFEGCSIDLTAWKAVAASIPEHGLEKLRLSFRRSGVTEAEAEELAELIRGRFPHMQSRRAIALAACVRAVVRSLLSQKCSAGHTFHTHAVCLQLTVYAAVFQAIFFCFCRKNVAFTVQLKTTAQNRDIPANGNPTNLDK